MAFGFGLLVLIIICVAPLAALAVGFKLQSTMRAGAFLLCVGVFAIFCFLAGAFGVYVSQPPQGIYQTHYANRDLIAAIVFIGTYQARTGHLPSSSEFQQQWQASNGNQSYRYEPSNPQLEAVGRSDTTYRVGIWEGDDFLYYDSAQHVFYYGAIGTKGQP